MAGTLASVDPPDDPVVDDPPPEIAAPPELLVEVEPEPEPAAAPPEPAAAPPEPLAAFGVVVEGALAVVDVDALAAALLVLPAAL